MTRIGMVFGTEVKPSRDLLLALVKSVGVVLYDNAAIGRQAADILLDRGLRNFAFLGSMTRRESIAGGQRSAGFEARVRAVLGEEATFSRWIMGTQMPNGDYWDSDWEPMKDWVSRLPCPCGMFVNGDREALALTRICRNMGVDVPGQLEILSINNTQGLCERAHPGRVFRKAFGMSMSEYRAAHRRPDA